MCFSTNNLYSGADGYVVWCSSCKSYEIAYISSLLKLSIDEFDNFRVLLAQYAISCSENNPNSKTCIIPLPSQNVSLILTKNELTKLHSIIENVDSDQKAARLLALFK